MISVSCSCGRKFKADDQHAGKRTRCPVCGLVLVIGQAPVTPGSGVSDNGEVPSWWFPSTSPPRPSMPLPRREPPPPTRSGSNPDDIQTAVVPVQPVPNPKSSLPEVVQAAPLAQPSVGNTGKWKTALSIMAGVLIICVLGVGMIAWVQKKDPAMVPLPLAPTVRAKNSDQQSTTATGVSERLPVAADQPTRSVAASTPRLQLLVPAYFYPAGQGLRAWERLMGAASKIRMVVIANPNSGPGDKSNPDYDLVLTAARKKGVRILGYVSTGYGKQDLSKIKGEIDRWFAFYPQINGFFFDQQSTEPRDVHTYLEIRDYAGEKVKEPLLINNPGAICDEAYFAQSVSDVICIYSGYEGFDQFSLPASLWQYEPSRFAAIAYQIRDVKGMRKSSVTRL